jgi:hypothetical protein
MGLGAIRVASQDLGDHCLGLIEVPPVSGLVDLVHGGFGGGRRGGKKYEAERNCCEELE